MKRAVRVLRRAERDIQQVYDLVAREAPRRVDRFIDRLLTAIESLEMMADRGAHPRDSTLREHGDRFLVHGRYLVFYKISARQVRVDRVLHASRAYRGLL